MTDDVTPLSSSGVEHAAPEGGPDAEAAHRRSRRSSSSSSKSRGGRGSRGRSRGRSRSVNIYPIVVIALAVALVAALVWAVVSSVQLAGANTALETVASQLRNERLARAKAEQEAEVLSLATTHPSASTTPDTSAVVPVLPPLPERSSTAPNPNP